MNKGDYRKGEIELAKEVKVYENRFCEFFDDEVIFPSGISGKFLRLSMKGGYSVAILPVTKRGEMVFIKTFRHSARGWGFEIPKGYGAETETPIECAKRELKEETGWTAKRFIDLGLYHESPSTMQYGLHCFIALDCEKKDDINLEYSEAIDGCVMVKSLQDLPQADYKDAITEMVVCKYLLTKDTKKSF